MNQLEAESLDSILRRISGELADFIGENKAAFDEAPSIRKDPLLRIIALTFDTRDEIYHAYENIRPEDYPLIEGK